MPEATTQTPTPLFSADIRTAGDISLSQNASLGSGGLDMSQSEKDAILRQIHPIFLTTHTDDKKPVVQSNFDKFLGFLRLCLEGLLKFVDIVVDAAIQIARLFVWVVAIAGVLIVVTLMTNTTDKFIDILNSSVFPIIGLETKIQKVETPTTQNTTKDSTKTGVDSDNSDITDLSSSALNSEPEDKKLTAAEKARQELIQARKARLAEAAATANE